ncbi:hypothetical protein FNV43_RR16272 [Rhamnella rubrinervis]|uniref:Uncharacterized protein n=1 Tax=Rhamnella rubrinervis TaxID=2594499 RepID=A0A8K0E513_9ROSA|nr:hypothetical protein FNV43_RR16272 [Rhamnella rubrinervis]
MADKMRIKEESLLEEIGTRQKSQWRSRRTKEVVEPKKNEEKEEGDHKEEEEEEITEEDLQDILMILSLLWMAGKVNSSRETIYTYQTERWAVIACLLQCHIICR